MTHPVVRLVVVAVTLAVAGACRRAPASDYEAGKMSWTRYSLPIVELSGLALATGPSGPELYAVGDEEAILVRVPWRIPLDPAAAERIALPVPTDDGGSQLEAVAVDGGGVVYVLDEERALVHALTVDGRTATLRHTFSLRVPRDHPLHKRWEKKENKRGEGLVILPGGHLLIAKQADPVALIEFGPAGEAAEGVTEVREARPTLPGGATSELVPLAVWTPDEATADRFETLSDLARAPGGGLYVVSSKPDPAFGRIRLPLPASGGSFAVAAQYAIPDAPTGKAEALVIAPAAEPAVIGFDTKGGGPNLVVSSPPP